MGTRCSFPDPTEQEQNDNIEEDISTISMALWASRLPSLNISAEITQPFDRPAAFHNELDLSMLVSTRHAHETKRAFKSVRKQVKDGLPENTEPTEKRKKPLSVRQRIFCEMNEVLKEDQDKRINTGANRKATWTNSAPGGRSADQVDSLAGNSANAELAAGQRALTVSTIRYM